MLWPVVKTDAASHCAAMQLLDLLFLVGWCTNKSYVIATSDLWLFIHASNLLSLYSPSPLPYKSWRHPHSPTYQKYSSRNNFPKFHGLMTVVKEQLKKERKLSESSFLTQR